MWASGFMSWLEIVYIGKCDHMSKLIGRAAPIRCEQERDMVTERQTLQYASCEPCGVNGT